jgi:hypothetical protein
MDATRLLTRLAELTKRLRLMLAEREHLLDLCLRHQPRIRGVDIAKAAGITEQAVTGRRRKIEREAGTPQRSYPGGP